MEFIVLAGLVIAVAVFFLTRPKQPPRYSENTDPSESTAPYMRRQPPAVIAPAPTVATPASSRLHGKCWVIDGDTIVIDNIHIRLSGIDAPELDHPYGKKAKSALIALCKGQVITVITDGRTSHNRTVGQCYLPDGRDLSAEMVRSGHALDWEKYSGGKYRHLETEDARQRLWRAKLRQKGRMRPTGSD